METRGCKKCGIVKELSNEFFYRDGHGYFGHFCKECSKQGSKEYRVANPEEVKRRNADWVANNKETSLAYHRQYYQDNKEKLKRQSKEYREDHKEELALQALTYYQDNRDAILEKKSEYEKKNRAKINASRRNRSRNNPAFRLRDIVSKDIRTALKDSGGSKVGGSSWEKLPYTPDDLVKHLEGLFEPWMNWDNYGKHNRKNWKEDDPTTWKWNIDHIIPQSKLSFDTMNHPNFLRCWGLDNLRPYCARQNSMDGNRRGEKIYAKP
jgi:hypothetical protein